MPNKHETAKFFNAMLLSCDTRYTDRQHPIDQRRSYSHSGGIFARYSVEGKKNEEESLISLGCFFVSLETVVKKVKIYWLNGVLYFSFPPGPPHFF
jgi:hypothetical protein